MTDRREQTNRQTFVIRREESQKDRHEQQIAKNRPTVHTDNYNTTSESRMSEKNDRQTERQDQQTAQRNKESQTGMTDRPL